MAEFVTQDGRITVRSATSLPARELLDGEGAELLGASGEAVEVYQAVEDSGFVLMSVLGDFLKEEPSALSADGFPAGEAEIEVETDEGEASVLLVESEGVFQWILPDPSPRPLSANGNQTDVFYLNAIGADETGPQFASGLWDTVKKRVFKGAVVYVLKYAVGLGVRAIASHIDGDGPFGLFTVQGSSPFDWTPQSGLVPLAGEKKRVLLLVHGTFSTTQGSFGDATGEDLKAHFFDKLGVAYDQVLGFDHKTLGESVEENARALSSALGDLDGAGGVTLDALGYSRGGLVLRHLIERFGIGDFSPGEFVFVGSTLSGTKLASPRNWNRLLDLYSTFAARAAKVGGRLVGQPQAGFILSQVMKRLGAFGKLIVSKGTDPKWVPGLASMVPSGPSVNAFDAPPKLGAHYHTVASDFEPVGGDTLGARIKLVMADLFIDDLFQTENDLVVHTSSMSQLPVQSEPPFEITGSDALVSHPPEDGVYHTGYFADPESLTAIAKFLGLADEGV